MLVSPTSTPDGISMRPAGTADRPFLENLYRSARPDLQFIDGPEELVEMVISQQYTAHTVGMGQAFPNAMHFVIEKTRHNVGAMVVDFGPNEVRVVYVAFVPEARGLGYGKSILRGVQQAASQLRCPIAVTVWHSNPGAKRVYQDLGFQLEETQPLADRMVWYPEAPSQ